MLDDNRYLAIRFNEISSKLDRLEEQVQRNRVEIARLQIRVSIVAGLIGSVAGGVASLLIAMVLKSLGV